MARINCIYKKLLHYCNEILVRYIFSTIIEKICCVTFCGHCDGVAESIIMHTINYIALLYCILFLNLIWWTFLTCLYIILRLFKQEKWNIISIGMTKNRFNTMYNSRAHYTALLYYWANFTCWTAIIIIKL